MGSIGQAAFDACLSEVEEISQESDPKDLKKLAADIVKDFWGRSNFRKHKRAADDCWDFSAVYQLQHIALYDCVWEAHVGGGDSTATGGTATAAGR